MTVKTKGEILWAGYNGVHVRRRDVLDIFMGTGLGSGSCAIIEQVFHLDAQALH